MLQFGVKDLERGAEIGRAVVGAGRFRVGFGLAGLFVTWGDSAWWLVLGLRLWERRVE